MRQKKVTCQSEDMRAPSTSMLIDEALIGDGLTKAILAHRLDRSCGTIRSFMRKDSTQTAILWEICHALKRNLFADIAAMLPEDYRSEALEAAKAELEGLRKERDLLLKAIEGR